MKWRQFPHPPVPRAVQRAGAQPVSHRLRATLPISGLTRGGGDALTVERALQAVSGVIRLYVNSATEMAYVEYDPRETGLDSLEVVIRSLGYGTEEREA